MKGKAAENRAKANGIARPALTRENIKTAAKSGDATYTFPSTPAIGRTQDAV